MFALAIVRYRRPLEEVLSVVEEHRAYLRELEARGTLLASGPLDPRSGGVLLLHIPGDDLPTVLGALDRIRDDDPYTRHGMAQYELLPWRPNIGVDGLEWLVGAT
jgi:uncharacterized protein YciI